MDNLPRQKLCELLTTYGRSLCDDPRRCEGLLRDVCGEYKREIHVLVNALKERVVADLLGSRGGVPQEVLFARLSQRLQDNLGLTQDAAAWAIESWALALGVSLNAPANSSQLDKATERQASAERKHNPVKPEEVADGRRSPAPDSRPAKAEYTSSLSGIRVTDRRVSRGLLPTAAGQSEGSDDVRSSSRLGADKRPTHSIEPAPPFASAKAKSAWIILAALLLIVMLAVYYINQERIPDISRAILQHDAPPAPPSVEITNDLALPREESPPTPITSGTEARGGPTDQFRDSATVVTRPAEGLPPGFGAEGTEKAMQRLYETITKAKEKLHGSAAERLSVPGIAAPSDEPKIVQDKPPGAPPAPRLGPRP
jgi:hypothetical protein